MMYLITFIQLLYKTTFKNKNTSNHKNQSCKKKKMVVMRWEVGEQTWAGVGGTIGFIALASFSKGAIIKRSQNSIGLGQIAWICFTNQKK